MTLQSGFFTSLNRDRLYKAEFFTSYFSSFIGNGVFPNPSNNLQVIAAQNLNVNVSPGKGWINGHYLRNDANYNLTLAPADGVLNRIDRIVFAVNFDTRNIEVYTKQGTLSANPVAPTLTRNATVYELALADVRINAGAVAITQAQITDLRPNASLCGIVSGTVNQVDVTTLYNQYASQFEQMTAQQQAQFDQFIADLQTILDGDVAANLASRILALENTTSDIDNRVTQQSTTIANQSAQIVTLQNNNQKATTAEAQAGTDNIKVMTPLRVRQAIDFNKALTLDNTIPLDNVKNNGVYYGFNFIGAPNTGISVLEVEAYNQDWIVQIIHDIQFQISHRRFFRSGTTWTAWEKILTQTDYDELFQSVSNGKAQVAAAITGKGITTAADATFATLTNNINAIVTSTRTASGTVQSTGDVSNNFYLIGGTSPTNRNSVTVNNLGFTPSRITITAYSGATLYASFYDVNNLGGNMISTNAGDSVSTRAYRFSGSQGDAYVNSTGFRMPVEMPNSSTFNWYAEE